MKTIIWIAIGYVLSYAWVLLPEKRVFKSPFPFFDIDIEVRYYFDYLGSRILYCILAYTVHINYNTFETKVAFLLFVGFIAEYLLTFNQPICWFQSGKILYEKPAGLFIPIGYSLFMGITLIFLAFLAWMKS